MAWMPFQKSLKGGSILIVSLKFHRIVKIGRNIDLTKRCWKLQAIFPIKANRVKRLHNRPVCYLDTHTQTHTHTHTHNLIFL